MPPGGGTTPPVAGRPFENGPPPGGPFSASGDVSDLTDTGTDAGHVTDTGHVTGTEPQSACSCQ